MPVKQHKCMDLNNTVKIVSQEEKQVHNANFYIH